MCIYSFLFPTPPPMSTIQNDFAAVPPSPTNIGKLQKYMQKYTYMQKAPFWKRSFKRPKRRLSNP